MAPTRCQKHLGRSGQANHTEPAGPRTNRRSVASILPTSYASGLRIRAPGIPCLLRSERDHRGSQGAGRPPNSGEFRVYPSRNLQRDSHHKLRLGSPSVIAVVVCDYSIATVLFLSFSFIPLSLFLSYFQSHDQGEDIYWRNSSGTPVSTTLSSG